MHEEEHKKPIIQALMNFLDNPFEEQRFAIFAVMKGLAAHPWGVKEMLEYPGFYEFIVSRRTESAKEGAEWKYAIIERMLKEERTQSVAKEVAGDSRFQELCKYVRDGVFYSERQVLVAAKSRN